MENIEILTGLAIGIVVGGIIVWLLTKLKNRGNISDSDFNSLKTELEELKIKLATKDERISQLTTSIESSDKIILQKDRDKTSFTAEIATLKANLKSAEKNEELSISKLNDLELDFNKSKDSLSDFKSKYSKIEATQNSLLENYKSSEQDISKLKEQLETKTNQFNESIESLAKFKAENKSLTDNLVLVADELVKAKEQLELKTKQFNTTNELLATFKADNQALQEKLATQKKEIEELGAKFNTEFTNIANKILEEKTEKFTNVNKESIDAILKPLGENIDKFKKQVEDVYDKESKERFSLAEQVKQMAELNKVISNEAKNLTQALKGEAKTQGNWGEMILESILEKSGLRKDEEYFMEHQLLDDDGKALRSDSENKKMRPDAVIKYPDNRNVIIDSKVSLNAFTRYLSATNKEDQDRELQMHVAAIKNHIVGLSTKGYDDYDKALDFVMMFVPSEPAYIAAMQGDSNLWNFAYDKRILLMNPTNLITSLKLIVDLWKREYQNQNAIEIASRGAKLYDKFVGFINNLEGVGDYLGKAQKKYDDAHKQLTTGNDNLVSQATKLKNLGLTTKKELPKGLK